MTVARGAALGALAVVVILVLFLILERSSARSYRLVFQNAGQLVRGNDVQVGGAKVGQVTKIDLTDDNLAAVTIKVKEGKVLPLHQGTRATIRATSLSGVANRYIALDPGPNNAPAISDGGRIQPDSTQSIVDLDQLFNTLDPRTRRGLQQVVQGSAEWYKGVESRANLAAKYFNPALSTTARLVNELNRDTGTFTSFLVETSRTMTALASRRQDLTNLVTNANTTAGAIGDERQGLVQALRLAPPTLRRANSTFVDLRAALTDLDALVDVSKPATRRLAPFLRALRPLVADARPTLADLSRTISSSGPDNDLIDLLHTTPKLGRQAQVVFPRAVRTLRRAQPVLEFIRPYAPELVGWFRDFGEGASTYDANGHYARIQPIFNTFSVNDQLSALQPLLEGNRLKGLSAGNTNRCPGTATQRRPDGSNPWRDSGGKLDCNPSEVPPGP